MIDEILKDIKDAEAKAEQLQKDAYAKGKEIVFNAELEAEKQKKSTVKECKADVKRAAEEAESAAALKRAAILRDGEKRAAELIAAKKNEVEKEADKVVGMLLSKYKI